MTEGGGAAGRVLFISHAEEDATRAEALSELVRAAFGLSPAEVFVSTLHGQGLAPGQLWAPGLLAKIEATDVALALVTADFLRSTFCAVELGALWARGTPIVPILVGVDPADRPAPLAGFQYIELDDDAPDGIIDAISQHRPDADVVLRRRHGTRFLELMAAVTEPQQPGAGRDGGVRPRPRWAGAVISAATLTVVVPSGDGLSVFERSWDDDTATRRRLPLPTPRSEPSAVGVGTYAGVGPHVEVFVASGDPRIDHVVDAGSGFGRWRTMTHPPRGRLAELQPVSSEPGTLTLYALDGLGRVWRQHWSGDDGDWDGWEEIDRPTTDDGLPPRLIGHLAVTSNWPGGEDLLAHDLTGGLWVGWTADGVTEWWPHGEQHDPRALAAVSRMRGHLELFVVDRAGAIHHTWRNPDEKGLPRPFAPMEGQPDVPVMSLAACAGEDGSEVLVAVDEAGSVVLRRFATDRWGRWSPISVTR